MNILDIVEYERPHAIKLKHPLSGEDLGVTINVISMESSRVAEAIRAVQRVQMESEIAGSPVDAEAAITERENAMMIAVIDSWDWNGTSPGADLGVDPECTPANKKALLTHKNAKWIKEQIASGCTRIVNFTQDEPKPVKNTSRSK